MTDWAKPTESNDTWAVKRQRIERKRCVVCGEPLKIFSHQSTYCSKECRLKRARENYAKKRQGI